MRDRAPLDRLEGALEPLEQPIEEVRGFLEEFREFAARGNVVDMAVGIIIGAAFTTVVTSLVNDVLIAPALALLTALRLRS